MKKMQVFKPFKQDFGVLKRKCSAYGKVMRGGVLSKNSNSCLVVHIGVNPECPYGKNVWVGKIHNRRR
ncbi:hypothetical protein D7024_09885 [Desulfofundulus salinus]|uniref:Uncharacterized protein n=1 Tax=Desulfofundulus salinus TaxID=2419843 RepID=A0A494WY35_9FIRM|nr:hypothetical protein D7024_09885 [Desulfofundulus salinum]